MKEGVPTTKSVLRSRARVAGSKAALSKRERPTEAEIQERNPQYTPEQIKIYLHFFDQKRKELEAGGTTREKVAYKKSLRDAKVAGRAAASGNSERLSETVLRARHPNYTDEHVRCYFRAFDAKKKRLLKSGDKSLLLIRQVRNSGYSAAKRGMPRPPIEELLERNPSFKEHNNLINVYYSGYDKKRKKIEQTGSLQKTLIYRAEIAGGAAGKGTRALPTFENVKAIHPDYNDEQIRAYIATFKTQRKALNKNSSEMRDFRRSPKALTYHFNFLKDKPPIRKDLRRGFVFEPIYPEKVITNEIEGFVFTPLSPKK